MHRLEVGKPYPGKPVPCPEGGWFGWSRGGLELFLSFRQLRAQETLGIRQGECEFALVTLPETPEAVWLLYRFPGVPWSDAPYTPHLLPAGERPDLELFRNSLERLFLQVVLVESARATVQAIRLVSLSPEFSRELLAAYLAAEAAPWDGLGDYQQKIARVYAHYQDSSDLLAMARCRCAGGA